MSHSRQWFIPCGEPPVGDYISFVAKLFRGNVPVPMVCRWYTGENASWFVYSMASFGILQTAVGDCYMRFRHGENPDSHLTEGMHTRPNVHVEVRK